MHARSRSAAAAVALAGALFLAVACSPGEGGPDTVAKTGKESGGSSATKEVGAMTLTSPAFEDGEPMPSTFAAIGRNLSPPLTWSGAPPGAKSFVLVCVDIHPIARNFVHWLVVDIPAEGSSLPEGASGRGMPPGSRELPTTGGRSSWEGPRPPAGTGPHTYEFTLYALDVEKLNVRDGSQLSSVLAAMGGHVLETAKTSGTYER